jgi:hypothetical protein
MGEKEGNSDNEGNSPRDEPPPELIDPITLAVMVCTSLRDLFSPLVQILFILYK